MHELCVTVWREHVFELYGIYGARILSRHVREFCQITLTIWIARINFECCLHSGRVLFFSLSLSFNLPQNIIYCKFIHTFIVYCERALKAWNVNMIYNARTNASECVFLCVHRFLLTCIARFALISLLLPLPLVSSRVAEFMPNTTHCLWQAPERVSLGTGREM